MPQSAGATSGMSYPQNLRPKQREVIDAFAHSTTVIAKMPTAYGKTMTAAGSFAFLMAAAKANRMLVVVKGRPQCNQIAEELPAGLSAFGVEARSLVVGMDQLRALKYHANGSVTVFIVTIQSLLSSGTWETVVALMQTGLWFVFVDEHHHYSDAGAWTERIKGLNHVALLATSATPNRHDGSDHFPDPTISETYIDAADSGYVKKLSLHAYHYTIDAVTVDGEVVQFTTEELADKAGSDNPDAIDAFMTSRKMRFSPKYVSPLVMFPVDRIVSLRAEGIRAQMLIQAMSCSHAKCVAEQVKSLLPSNMRVDWCGTGDHGRTQEDNDRIIREFCPPKNKATGRREWTLDVLVNVGMAGEGMDSIDVTEITFLTSANITITNKQIIGRGARLMKALPVGAEQPIAHVNVDTTSPMAAYIGPKIMRLFDEEVQVPPEAIREMIHRSLNFLNTANCQTNSVGLSLTCG